MHMCLRPCGGHHFGYHPLGPIHLEFCSCLSLFCWQSGELMTWHVNGSHRPACRSGFSPHSMLFQGWTQNLRFSAKHLYLMIRLTLLSLLLKPCLSLAWGFQSRLGYLASKSQGSSYSHIPSTQITRVCCHALVLMCVLRIEHGSLHLRGKHFIN